MKQKIRLVLARIGCGIAALLAAVLLLGGLFIISWSSSWGQDFAREEFDREIWLSMTGSEEFENPRGPMTKDLMKYHLKAGMSREAIVELLGEPDYDSFPEANSASPPGVLRYYLGFWSGLHMDPDSLDLHLDESGIFVEAKIVQH